MNNVIYEVMNDDSIKKDCSICYESNITNLNKKVCESCRFECCDDCYSKIESNACPICKNPQFKTYHPETISVQDQELFQDVIAQIENTIIQEYEDKLLSLFAIIITLQQKNKEKDKIIKKYKTNRMTCICGKEIMKSSYERHCESKFHKKFCYPSTD